MPAALIWGKQDALVAASASRLAAKLLKEKYGEPVEEPGGLISVAVSQDSGHFLRWGAPDLVSSALQEIQAAQITT